MDKYILLSIQPRIVKEIIDGEKKFEFRKKFPDLADSNISRKVIIYCSSPIMQIIGSFVVKQQFHADFDVLMNQVNADMSYRIRISNYFEDKSSCYAMEISQLKIYETPLPLNYLRIKYPGFCPGQSYRYLDNKITAELIEKNNSL